MPFDAHDEQPLIGAGPRVPQELQPDGGENDGIPQELQPPGDVMAIIGSPPAQPEHPETGTSGIHCMPGIPPEHDEQPEGGTEVDVQIGHLSFLCFVLDFFKSNFGQEETGSSQVSHSNSVC